MVETISTRLASRGPPQSFRGGFRMENCLKKSSWSQKACPAGSVTGCVTEVSHRGGRVTAAYEQHERCSANLKDMSQMMAAFTKQLGVDDVIAGHLAVKRHARPVELSRRF